MAKPTEKPRWASTIATSGSTIETPSSGKQDVGWVKEKPPYQWFNWMARWTYEWLIYFEGLTDGYLVAFETQKSTLNQIAAGSVASPASGKKTIYMDSADGVIKRKDSAGVVRTLEHLGGWDAVVGSLPMCTHADLATALADSAVAAGSRILVMSNQTINTSAISISKANLYIEFAPGVTFTAGTSTTGLTVAAGGVRIRGGRFSGFTTAISITNTFNNCVIIENRFASCTNEVTDNNTSPTNVIANNISE